MNMYSLGSSMDKVGKKRIRWPGAEVQLSGGREGEGN